MKLNLQTDYALRLLTYLAVNDNSLSTIADVAKRYDISKNHLMKVAHILGREGVIEAVRGRTGGLRLAHPAKDINVGAIVRLMEADLEIVECFQASSDGCLIAPACKLKGIFYEALEAFLSVLDQYTIDQLTHRNDKLAALLQAEIA